MTLERISGTARSLVSAALAAAVVMAIVSAWAPDAGAELKAVASVNGVVLTERDLNDAYNKVLPAASFHGGISQEKRESYRDEAIERMINDELLYQEAVRTGLKMSRKELKEEKDKVIERLGGSRQYMAALKNSGLTEKEHEEALKKKFLIEKIFKMEVADKAEVTEEEARENYERNKPGFMRPEAWRLRHILVSVAPNASQEEWDKRRARAVEALEKIKAGEDMAQVAWDYSDDPYRVKGGDLGLVHSGRLVGEVESAVRGLGVGETSGVVQSIYGYHIVRVEEKKEPVQLTYEEVQGKIKRELKAKRLRQYRDELEKRLRANARIEVYP